MVDGPKYLTGDSVGIKEFIDKFDAFLFDCDGVLWSGDDVFEGVPETLHLLRTKGKKIIFVTNNSTKSRQDYVEKLTAMGIEAGLDDVFGSAYSAAVYIARILRLPAGRNKVYVIGEAGVEQELEAEGVPYVGGTDPAFRRHVTPADMAGLADGSLLDPAVGAVLCGLDFHVNYLKLAHGLHYLRRGARFLATNTDATLPMHRNVFLGAGACMAPLIAAAGGAQPLALGKPARAMMDAIEGRFHLDRARTCMVGDRLNTDIQFGIDSGLGGTLHVLTGVHTRKDWEAEDAIAVPTFYADKLSDLRNCA